MPQQKCPRSPTATLLDGSGPNLVGIGPRTPKPVEVDSQGVILADSQTMVSGHISADEADFENMDENDSPRRPRKRRKKHKSMPSNQPENIQSVNLNRHYQQNPLSDPVELGDADAAPEPPTQPDREDEKQHVVEDTETPSGPQVEPDNDSDFGLHSDVEPEVPESTSTNPDESNQDNQIYHMDGDTI